MKNWDDFEIDDRRKWAEWTARPRKSPPTLARYASAVVLALSAVVLSGAHLPFIL